MKIAIMFSGRILGYDIHYESIMKHIVQTHDVDFFLSHSPELIENLDGFVELYRPKLWTNEPILSNTINIANYQKSPETNVHNVMCMWYNRKRVFELVETYQQETNTKYDILISCRLDTRFNQFVDYSWMNSHKLCIPNPMEDFRDGLSDQFAMGSFDAMKVYHSIPSLLQHGCIFHPETILRTYFQMYPKLKIQRFLLDYTIER